MKIKNKFIGFVFTAIHVVSFSQNTTPYDMCSLHWDIDKYFNLPAAKRKFDKEGIITQKGAYHALTISAYGIMCFDEFKESGDSTFYHRVVNQFKYFQDSSKLIAFDDGMAIGLPYRMNYKGLKAPWFSGLTQGIASSFLLRYYELTKDEYALELSKKIVRFMLKPESEGGTIGKTAEGCTWIEEYPNSKQSKSVLNGFVLGLVGLKEYLNFYPNDFKVKSIHDECYESLFETIQEYDKPNWTSYNRNGGSISKFYLRFQISQFDHLYQLYNDERFRLQMKIWAKFAYNKFDKSVKFFKENSYQFSEKIKKNDSGYVFSDSLKYYFGMTELPFSQMNKINSRKLEVKIPSSSYYTHLVFNNQGKRAISIEFLYKEEVIDQLKYKNVDSVVYSIDRPFDEIKFRFSKKMKNDLLPVSIRLYDYKTLKLPMFVFIDSLKIENLQKGNDYLFDVYSEGLVNAIVYYRYGKQLTNVKKSKFNLKNSFNLNDGFTPRETGFYEFFISYDIQKPNSVIKRIEFKQVQKDK